MKEQITYDIFDKIDIRVGTVISVKKNEKARKPSLVIEVDFGKDIGVKQSSAQITHYYNEENLKGKKLTKEQEAWMEKQKLYATHPIYNNYLIRKICNDFDGKVIEVNGKSITQA